MHSECALMSYACYAACKKFYACWACGQKPLFFDLFKYVKNTQREKILTNRFGNLQLGLKTTTRNLYFWSSSNNIFVHAQHSITQNVRGKNFESLTKTKQFQFF
jgi:hypothetical protein